MRRRITAKPFVAAALAAAMALNITAFAAPESQAPAAAAAAATAETQQGYTVQVVNGQLQFFKDGQVVRTVDLKSASLLLTKSKDGGVAIQVVDATGKARKFTLGSQSQVEIGGQLEALTLSPTLPASSKVSVHRDAKVKSLTVRSASKVELAGEVTSLEVTNPSAQVAVADSAKVAQVSSVSASAVKGVSASKVKVTSGQGSASRQDREDDDDDRRPSSNNSSSNNSGSNNGGGGNDNRPQEENAILRVETEGSSLVRVTMKHPVKLTQDDFSIICTGAGKDMTILSVSTQDNLVYELRTAQYFDNTYNIQITLPDGSRVDKDFEVKILVVEITSPEMTRKDDGTAEFFYMADEEGDFYYLLQEKSLLRSLWNKPQEPTVEEILSQGTRVPMAFRENLVTITGLKPNTGYTMYYAAKDSLGRVTPIHYADIDAKPQEDTGNQGDITIEKLEVRANNSTDFIQVHNYFVVTLSQATQQPLTGENFTVNCSKGEIPLEAQVETTDNRVYTVNVKAGHMLYDSRFTLTVTFPDGTTASASAVADSSAPLLSVMSKPQWNYSFESEATSNSAIQITIDSDEPGFLYYVVLPDEDSFHDASPKDPKRIINHPDVTKLTLRKGTSSLNLPYYPKGGVEYLCLVAEDEMGNTGTTYDYEKLPAYDPPQQPGGGEEGGQDGGDPGQPEQPQATIEFVGAEAYPNGPLTGTKISFKITPAPDLFSKDYVTIVGEDGTILNGSSSSQIHSSGSTSDNPGLVYVVTYSQLDPDNYTLTYNDGTVNLSFTFTIS